MANDDEITFDKATEEFKANNSYRRGARGVKDPHAKKVMNNIADEELVHSGELLEVVEKVNPHAVEKIKEGYNEAKEMKKSSTGTIEKGLIDGLKKRLIDWHDKQELPASYLVRPKKPMTYGDAKKLGEKMKKSHDYENDPDLDKELDWMESRDKKEEKDDKLVQLTDKEKKQYYGNPKTKGGSQEKYKRHADKGKNRSSEPRQSAKDVNAALRSIKNRLGLSTKDATSVYRSASPEIPSFRSMMGMEKPIVKSGGGLYNHSAFGVAYIGGGKHDNSLTTKRRFSNRDDETGKFTTKKLEVEGCTKKEISLKHRCNEDKVDDDQ